MDRIKLPMKKSKEGYSLETIRMLFYGPPKIGKSTFCSFFDRALFLATEKGLKGLDVFKVDITDWEEFVSAVNLLYIKEHDFKTIIIDTVDNLFKFCIEYVCKKNRIDHPSDSKWGKGWDLLQKEFEKPILQLSMSNYGLVFVSHEKEYEVSTKHLKYTKIGPSIPNQARKVIIPFVDIIGRCYIEKSPGLNDELVERRRICFTPSENIEAGDRTGLMPESIPLKYAVFAKQFKKAKGEEDG